MPSIPVRINDRLCNCLKRFQPVLSSARSRDVNESDTVIIVTDLLAEAFGYDKYSEITSEHAIRGTFCDLVTVVEGKVHSIIEVKAIGLELKDAYVKQAVDYAANKGVEWVILTNGISWKIFKIHFSKPIDQELVFEIDLLTADAKNENDVGLLYLLTKEAWQKELLVDYHQQRQALSRFYVGAVITSECVVDVIRRELRRICPDVKIVNEQIEEVLLQEVLKREVVEGEKADEARRKISRAANRTLRAKAAKEEAPAEPCSSNRLPTQETMPQSIQPVAVSPPPPMG